MTNSTRSFTARLRFATIKSKRLDDSVRFYEDVLGFPRTSSADGYVQLDAGGAQLCVDQDGGEDLSPRLIFAVDDINGAYDHLRQAGVEIIAGGRDEGWLVFRDPDGNQMAFEAAR